MCILGSVLHMLLLLGFLTVVKNVECDAIETKKPLELFSEIKKIVFFMMFQVFWTEFLPIIVLWEESNKIFLCFNFFASFWIHIKLTFTLHCFFDAVNMLVAYLWNVTTLWLIWCLWWVCVTGEGVCPLCPSTLLLHFFNQQQKKALFWPVCQQCPASTPLQL